MSALFSETLHQEHNKICTAGRNSSPSQGLAGGTWQQPSLPGHVSQDGQPTDTRRPWVIILILPLSERLTLHPAVPASASSGTRDTRALPSDGRPRRPLDRKGFSGFSALSHQQDPPRRPPSVVVLPGTEPLANHIHRITAHDDSAESWGLLYAIRPKPMRRRKQLCI